MYVTGQVFIIMKRATLVIQVSDLNKPDPVKKNDSGADVTFKRALHKYHGQFLATCFNATVSGFKLKFRKKKIYIIFLRFTSKHATLFQRC